MIYLAQFLSKSFEKKDIFCYTECVNTGRNVMAHGLKKFIGYTAFVGLMACGEKKEAPTPITPVDQYKEVHVNVIQNVTMNRSDSNFKKTAITNEDNSTAYGLDAVAYGTDNSRISTTTWSANSDNIPFTVNVHKENITYGNNSVKGGEYWLASNKPTEPVISFNGKKEENSISDLAVAQEINTAEKIKIFKHVKQINLYAPGAIDGGIRITGSLYADNETYLKYIANCADTQNAKTFASRRYLRVVAGQNTSSSYTVIP